METFENRLKLQKVIYLLQCSGVNLGYPFSWYLHGPYSPELTKDAYLIEDFSKVKKLEFEDSEIESKFKGFIERLSNHKDDVFWLEVSASIHLLKKLYPQKSEEQVVDEIKNKGVDFRNRGVEIRKIWNEFEGWSF